MPNHLAGLGFRKHLLHAASEPTPAAASPASPPAPVRPARPVGFVTAAAEALAPRERPEKNS